MLQWWPFKNERVVRVGTGLVTIFENPIFSTQVPFSIHFPDPEKALQCSHNFLRLSKLCTNPLTHSHATQQLKHTLTHTHTHKPGSHLYPHQTAVAEEAWPERCCRTCGCSSRTTQSCGRACPGWETGLHMPAPDQRECSTVAEVGGPSWTHRPDTAGTGSDLRTQSSQKQVSQVLNRDYSGLFAHSATLCSQADSLCRKCRRQVADKHTCTLQATATHACTIRMWLCMK